MIQKAQVNPELISSWRPELNLPWNGNHNTNKSTSKECVEQSVCKGKVLRSLRNFPYELIFYSWYRPKNPNFGETKKKSCFADMRGFYVGSGDRNNDINITYPLKHVPG